jgi:uncharacterized SAM-binding protein YcdF (DUF218 family)
MSRRALGLAGRGDRPCTAITHQLFGIMSWMQNTVDRRVVRRGAATLTLVALAVLAVTTARWFVWPDTDDPTRADAVVMFAGGRGERLPVALRMAERGVAPTLVVMNGTDPVWPQANELCAGKHTFTVVCPTPDPDTTQGEARIAAALASDEGWRSLILVTSDYHLHRAWILLDRCFDGDIALVAAHSDAGVVARTRNVLHEWFASIAATIDRDC